MRVWIDLANSPHPLLFAPIAARIGAEGGEVLVTFRDHAQTAELTRERFPHAELIGGPSPSARAAKLGGIVRRISDLRSWAQAKRPAAALSHNSYAQLAAARSLGIPGVTAMDYEHQPANHLAFRCAEKIMVPEALPTKVLKRQGAKADKLVRYQGLKEEIYLADFVPDPDVLDGLGIDRDRGAPLVVARTAPAGAAYHQGENPILVSAVKRLVDMGADCVVLARHQDQAMEFRALDHPSIHVPATAVDSRSLLAVADAFLGAGGTMTREAALMGIPTFSLFSGPPPAADRWLENQGKLTRITEFSQLPPIGRRANHELGLDELREAGKRLIEVFSQTTLRAATS